MTVTTETFDPFYSGFNASKALNVYIFEFCIPSYYEFVLLPVLEVNLPQELRLVETVDVSTPPRSLRRDV